MIACHLTTVHAYNDGRIFNKECRTLSKKGYQVHLIAPNAPDKVENGIYVHGISRSSNRIKRMLITTYKVYKKAKEINADIYHFHDPELIFAGLMLKSAGKKVVYDVHEDVPRQILSKYWIPRNLRKIVSKFVELIENFCSKKFDGIIAATPYIARRFEKMDVLTETINNYPLLHELWTEADHCPEKEQAVIYVGGITSQRGLFQMIEAIELTKYKLYLGGNFAVEKERNIAMTMSGWKKTIELGFINRDEMKEYIAKSSAGLVLFHPEPNHIHAQPNKLFEYMSAGLPVIASNFPLWKEIVEGNQCGICVDPLNVDEIRQSIDWIMDHPGEALEMGKNGRKAIEEKYNWENESKKLIEFYQKL